MKPTRSRWLILCVVTVAALSAAVTATAESFGPLPGPDQSRCAALRASRKLLNIGQRIVLRAGPITDQCGGPAATTHYAWQTTDQTQPSAAPGLVQLHPCRQDAHVCTYVARLFTQPHMWQSVGIQGTSPDGGWSAGVPYAIRYGHYFMVSIGINGENPPQPKSVTLSGKGHRESTTASQSGVFLFAALAGTYTVSYTLGHRSVSHTYHLKAAPGGSAVIEIA
jgi:hypothetical protein